ncbi:MAG TPA: hypothetical protein VJR29_09755, partial [bacterium]|nr:hypothetical protein [bacterium]
TLDISQNLVINGPGSSVLAISGNDLGQVIFVDIGATVVIRDLSITDGLIDDEGGGLRNDGILTLEDMRFSQNQAVDASGGALVNQGTMIIRDSVFENNEAQSGGAIFNVAGSDLTAERLLIQDAALSIPEAFCSAIQR